jgi:Ca-activated chloride channel family protein
MSALSQLHFLRPLWLLALPLLPLLGWWWMHRRQRETAWRRHVDAHLLPHLLEGGGHRARSTGVAAMLASVLAILALAGPAWRLGEDPLWRSRTPLVVALDLSSATQAADLPPSRLLQVRAKLATLLRERDGGQVGLVVFADDAYTVAPLTEDTGNIALFLDSLAPDAMPVDGHRADRAIAWSARLLRQAGFDRGDILLITDHADDAARSEAAAAARAGYRVSVLGLGTAAGAPYRNADGLVVQARLDADSLSSLARAGKGRYAAMTTGDADLRALDVLSAAEADTVAAAGGGRRWRDDGYWLLPPLMLLALFAFRRGSVVAVMLLAVLLPMPRAHAQALVQQARQQVPPVHGTPWRRADQVAHGRMQAAERAYRAGDYAHAAEQYAGIDTADAHYNRGNALAKQGAYPQAIAEYDRALRMQPRMADAIANKRAVQAAMKRKPPQGQQDGSQKQQQNQGQQQGKQDQAQQDGQQGGGQQPSPSQQPSGQSPSQSRQQQDSQRQDAGSQQQGQPKPSPVDAATQRAADVAQRERMQRALQARQAQGGKDAKPAQVKAETPAERERRLANEAWLRRVPDDPGGLLRAKFRLEYERRQQGGSE